MVSQLRGHRRGDSQRLVDAEEIVMREMQGQRRLEIFQLL